MNQNLDKSAARDLDFSSNWQQRVLLIGGLLGAVIGVLSAIFYIRSADESETGGPPNAPAPREAVRVGMSLLSIMRTIAEWGTQRVK
jgi:hypothetical protein